MYKVDVDLTQSCGECNKYHYVVYKWNKSIWENYLAGVCDTPQECFTEATYRLEQRIKNEQTRN